MLVNDLWIELSRMRGSERVRVLVGDDDIVEVLGIDYDADGVVITLAEGTSLRDELQKALDDCANGEQRVSDLEAAIRTFIRAVAQGGTWDNLPKHVCDAIDALEKVADDS